MSVGTRDTSRSTPTSDVVPTTFTVCVCTRNRPADLAECLESIERSEVPVESVIVSDDSDDSAANEAVCAEFARATHVAGPRLGLCANRNNALGHVGSSHVLFLDDDARLAPDFLTKVARRLALVRQAAVIVTGQERRNGTRITAARDQGFLGFQERVYAEGEPYRTVVINAAVFPTELFAEIGFDDSLRYGYDEVDLTTRAVAAGYEIEAIPDAINDHFPSEANRDEYTPVVDASRLYVTLRRLAVTDRRAGAACAFVIAAPVHLLTSWVREDGFKGLVRALSTLRIATGYVWRGRRGATIQPPLRRR